MVVTCQKLGGDLERLGNRSEYDKILSFREFDYIFKREYLIDKEYESNVYSLPFCFNFDHFNLWIEDFNFRFSHFDL